MTNDEKYIEKFEEDNGVRFDARWQTVNPFVFWYRPRHQDYLRRFQTRQAGAN